MKVLFISHEDSKFGAPKSLMELMRTLKNKYDIEPVVMLHSKDDVYDFCRRENIEAHVVGHRNITCGHKSEIVSHLKKIPKNIVNRFDDYRALNYIKKNIDMSKIDIIHSNVTITTLGMLLNKKFNIPHVVHLREAAGNVENFVYTRDYIKTLKNGVNYYIAISKFNKREWIKRGLPSEKVHVIYNGLDLSKLEEVADCNQNDGRLRVVFSGAISEDKGQITLIEAIHRLSLEKQNKVIVDFIGAGDSEYQKKLVSRIKQYNLEETVNLLGYIDNAVMRYSNYDVGIIASKAEAFGRVTVEYMASKLCVIASNAGANTELIKDGVNGLIFKLDDANDLAEKLFMIMDNRQYIEKLSECAYATAFSEFTTEKNAKNVYDLYCQIKRSSKKVCE